MAIDHEDGVAPPSNDAYTGMLSVSLLALVGSCVLLYLDYSRYPDANPPPVQKFVPDKKAPENIIGKAEFSIFPGTFEMAPGKEKRFSVRNGKIDSIDTNPKDDSLTIDQGETNFIIKAAPEAKEQEYSVFVKSKDDKTATLKLTVKKAE